MIPIYLLLITAVFTAILVWSKTDGNFYKTLSTLILIDNKDTFSVSEITNNRFFIRSDVYPDVLIINYRDKRITMTLVDKDENYTTFDIKHKEFGIYFTSIYNKLVVDAEITDSVVVHPWKKYTSKTIKEQVDDILDKINECGYDSLDISEIDLLKRYSTGEINN